MKRFFKVISVVLIIILSFIFFASCSDNTPTAGITLNTKSRSLTLNETFQLTATIKDTNNTAKGNLTITWKSSDIKVAIVDEEGLVSAIAIGDAVITAYSKGLNRNAYCDIAVINNEGYRINEKIEGRNIQFQIIDVKTCLGDQIMNRPVAGKIYVGVKIEMKNLNATDYIMTHSNITAKYNNEIINESIYAKYFFGGSIFGFIPMQETNIGWFAILLPENWEEFNILYQFNLLYSGTAKFVIKKEDVSENLGLLEIDWPSIPDIDLSDYLK